MLPPMVPMLRTCSAADAVASSPRGAGTRASSIAWKLVVADAGADACTPSGVDLDRAAARRDAPMKTAGEMSRMNLVTQSPTSVEPATIVGFGISLRAPRRGRRREAGTISRSLARRRCRRARRRRARRAAPRSPRARPSSGSASGEAVAGHRLGRARRSARSRCSGRDCPAAPSRSRPRDGVGLAHPEAVERHDEARRAEAALRAVAVDHRLLHRVQLAVRAARCSTVTTWQPSSEAERSGCRH